MLLSRRTCSLGQPAPSAASAGAGLIAPARSVKATMAPTRPMRELRLLRMFAISLELHADRLGHCLLAHREARSQLGLLAMLLGRLTRVTQRELDLVTAGVDVLLDSRLEVIAGDLHGALGARLDRHQQRVAIELGLGDLYRWLGRRAAGDGDLCGLFDLLAVLGGYARRHRKARAAEVVVRAGRHVGPEDRVF